MTVNKYSFVIGWCVLFDEENPLIFVTKCSIWMFSRVVTYDLWYTWNSWIIVWNKKCRVKNERKIKYWIQTISTKQYIVNRTSMYCVLRYFFRHKKSHFSCLVFKSTEVLHNALKTLPLNRNQYTNMIIIIDSFLTPWLLTTSIPVRLKPTLDWRRVGSSQDRYRFLDRPDLM
jgi:hypothetical protein